MTKPKPPEEPRADRWVTVHRGPMWEALALQAKLEAHGVPAFLPDQHLKTIDPFVTGADAFGVSLQVPESALDQARGLLLTEREAGRAPLARPEGEDEETETERELRARGRRLRWVAVASVVFAPFGLYGLVQSVSYVRAVARADVPPRGHELDLAAIGVVLLALFGWGLYAVQMAKL